MGGAPSVSSQAVPSCILCTRLSLGLPPALGFLRLSLECTRGPCHSQTGDFVGQHFAAWQNRHIWHSAFGLGPKNAVVCGASRKCLPSFFFVVAHCWDLTNVAHSVGFNLFRTSEIFSVREEKALRSTCFLGCPTWWLFEP